MGALGHLSKGRHVAVGLAIAGTSALAAFGVIGDGNPEERVDSWQTIVEPAGGDALRITEIIDWDFGDNRRHGVFRAIPNDFGAPTDIEASSPDAPGRRARRRPGVPDDHQDRRPRHDDHRAASLHPGVHTARGAALDRCAEHRHPRRRRVRAGITSRPSSAASISTTLGARRSSTARPPSATSSRATGSIGRHSSRCRRGPASRSTARSSTRSPRSTSLSRRSPSVDRTTGSSWRSRSPCWACSRTAGVYVWARRRGRNEVYAGGAADAAFGDLPPPTPNGSPRAGAPTMLVADDELDEMATIEFVPPKGLQPWEGAVLLDEKLGDETVQLWLSGLAGREAIEIDDTTSKVAIGSGRRRGELDATDAALLDGLIGTDGPYADRQVRPGLRQGVEGRGGDAEAAHRRQRMVEGRRCPALRPRVRGGGSLILGGLGLVLVISGKATGHMFSALRVMADGARVRGRHLGGGRLPRLRVDAVRAQRPGVGAGVADRVVPALPARQRGAARRVGMEARPRSASTAGGRWRSARPMRGRTRSSKANIPEPCAASAMPAILAVTSSSITSSHVQPGKGGSGGGGRRRWWWRRRRRQRRLLVMRLRIRDRADRRDSDGGMQIGAVIPHHEIGNDPGAIRAYARGPSNSGSPIS